MLKAYINNVTYDIIDGQINWELDAVDDFTITIIASDINWQDALNKNVEIVFDDITLIDGYVTKTPSVTVDSFDKITVTLDCIGQIGRLMCKRAKRGSHFQNQLLYDILDSLVTFAQNWEMNLVNFPVDKQNEVLTLDLRPKETLFSQIVEAVQSVPGIHLRYGGFNSSTGNYIIEFGEFNDVNTYIEKGFNLQTISVEPQENITYREIESYSGLSDGVRVRLNRASTDPRYLTSDYITDYPISQDPNDLAWVVTNNNAPSNVTCTVRKSFEPIKTKNDTTPTVAELEDVSWTLYLKTVRYLQESMPSNLYNMQVTYNKIPRVGDKARLNAYIEEPIFSNDSISIIGYKPTIDISDNFRMTRISFPLSEIYDNKGTNEFLLDITCSENDELGYSDQYVALYLELDKFDEMNEDP